jgi:hypothetical protein
MSSTLFTIGYQARTLDASVAIVIVPSSPNGGRSAHPPRDPSSISFRERLTRHGSGDLALAR